MIAKDTVLIVVIVIISLPKLINSSEIGAYQFLLSLQNIAHCLQWVINHHLRAAEPHPR